MHKVLGPPSQVHVHNKLTAESVQLTSTFNHSEKSLWSYTSSLNLCVHPMNWSNLTKSVTLFALHDLVVPHLFSSPSLFGLCPRSTGCSNTHCWNCTITALPPAPLTPGTHSSISLAVTETFKQIRMKWNTDMDDNLWFPGMELYNEHFNTTVKDAFKISVVPMIPCLWYR